MVDGTALPERWLPVVGYEGLYEVSDQGRVRSLDRLVPGCSGSQRLIKGRMLKPCVDANRRQQLILCRDGRQRGRRVHQLVAEAFLGPCPNGLECCHENGDPSDNRVTNLRWDTHLANIRDKDRHGTQTQRKTGCPLGHALAAPNLIPTELPHRACLACSRGRSIVRYYATKGVVKDMSVEAGLHYSKIMSSRSGSTTR